jgi:hypothetical protein
VEVGDHKLTTEDTFTANGATKKSKTTFIYDGPDIEGKDPRSPVEVKSADEKVKVAKGEFDATRVEMYMSGALMAKTWFSKDVPVVGIVKTQNRDGKDMMVLTDFGKGK